MTTFAHFLSFMPFISLMCAITAAVMADGYRKKKKATKKDYAMAQLYNFISVLWVIVGLACMGR